MTTFKKHEKNLRYRDGRIYFTARAERKVLFILTVAMLIAGMMVKL